MIVKDEEKFLADCLKSLVGQVDEVVVVDTGSRDKTRAIASAAGALVSDYAWTGDFAAARNAALDRASGDWILYIDADERLQVPAGVRLSTVMTEPGAVAVSVIFQPRPGFTAYRELRLFRKDPRIRFAGRIHETAVPAIHAVCREDGLTIRDSAFRILHVGYEGDLTAKHHRNLPLLRQAVLDNPGRVYYWQHLAQTLAALGYRDEAISTCRQAIKIARQSSSAKERVDGALAYQTLAKLFEESSEAALSVAEEGLETVPENRALMFIRARALVGLSRHEEALTVLDFLTAEDPDGFLDPLIAYDRRLFGELAHDLRGVALMRLERFEEAAAAFERAAATSQENLEYRTKAAAMRGHAKRTAPLTG